MIETAHRSGRAGWLRAAVLGADDGIVSTASLMIGVAASAASAQAILIAGVAGLVAGAMSMAAGEYVSVSAQRDTEQADVEREKGELATVPQSEMAELTAIYVQRGLDPDLAAKVAEQLSAHDRLGAHLRDELGIDQAALARPFQAAWISAASFTVFGACRFWPCWSRPSRRAFPRSRSCPLAVLPRSGRSAVTSAAPRAVGRRGA